MNTAMFESMDDVDSERVSALVADAQGIIKSAVEEHGVRVLWTGLSGGNDSVVVAHVVASLYGSANCLHIETGIGIPATTSYVRQLCRARDWHLRCMSPPDKGYEELVAQFGFPYGRDPHNMMYRWLKERCIDTLVREEKEHRHDRIGIVTGVRKLESMRRFANVKERHYRDGCKVWISPLFDWTIYDVRDYLLLNEITPNPVVRIIGHSGECMCGAFAHKGEREIIREHFPALDAQIADLEEECRLRGKSNCTWGQRMPAKPKRTLPAIGLFCVGCDAQPIGLEETLSRVELETWLQRG